MVFILLLIFVIVSGSDDQLVHIFDVGSINFPCTIAKVESLSMQRFLGEFRDQKPVIIARSTNNSKFASLTTLDALSTVYGSRKITLASSNTYSRSRKTTTMEKYIKQNMNSPVSLAAEANTTWYFFGDYVDSEWEELLSNYMLPPWSPELNPRLSFGLGPHNSGVPFHFHGPGFSEVLHGKKRWFLYPRGQQFEFDPERTTLAWLHSVYNSLPETDRPLECVIQPGEILYFPDQWYHGTLNIGPTVFVSTFTDERNIAKNKFEL
mmetsp:Transcript_32898/g.64527  ORF Transcript_32898/g.64527 Transcript_32898/m.64527 type:complete len:265 (+) Transcript_32898:74-868(+)